MPFLKALSDDFGRTSVDSQSSIYLRLSRSTLVISDMLEDTNEGGKDDII